MLSKIKKNYTRFITKCSVAFYVYISSIFLLFIFKIQLQIVRQKLIAVLIKFKLINDAGITVHFIPFIFSKPLSR